MESARRAEVRTRRARHKLHRFDLSERALSALALFLPSSHLLISCNPPDGSKWPSLDA